MVLPLSDIAGIDRLVQSTLMSMSGVNDVAVVDVAGRLISPRSVDHPWFDVTALSEMSTQGMMENEQVISFSLPLNSRLETEGYLQVDLSRPFIERAVLQIFSPLFVMATVLVVLAFPVTWLLYRSSLPTFWREQGWFTLSFSILSLALVMVLTGLYIQTAGQRVEQANTSLVARLSEAESHNIPLNLISGIDGLLEEYHQLNPELEDITLSHHGIVEYSARPERLNSRTMRNFYQLSDHAILGDSGMKLTATMPFSQVLLQVLRAGKNIVILYITILLLSRLFTRLVRQPGRRLAALTGQQADRTLEVLRPLFFIAVFMESLHIALLPKLLNELALISGLGAGLTSTLFMLYFLSFALTLLPGNRLCQHWGNRTVLLIGFLLATTGSLLLGFGFFEQSSLWLVIAARVVAGVGQSLLMVAIQNEILANTTISNRTSGASIIVTSFQGGFICGAALGALLASYTGATGVFVISGLSGVIALLLAVGLLPFTSKKTLVITSGHHSLSDIKVLLSHRGFLGSMLCIGIPAKATLTGIVTFALPLVMGQAGFASEDIGQVVICYAAAVLLSTRVLAPRVDRWGRTRSVLVIAIFCSGLAVMTLAYGLWMTTCW